MNTRDAQFLNFTRGLQLGVPREQIEAVATAIGCPEWTDRCDRDGECYCATAARRVVEIEKGQQ